MGEPRGHHRHRFRLPVAVLRRHQRHRHAEALGHLDRVDTNAELLRLVRHVEQQHAGEAEPLDLHRERELAIHLHRVQHDRHQIDRRRLQQLADHALVVGKPVHVVDAGQVDDLDHVAAEQDLRRQQIDRDARPVADARRRARHSIEECRLARVGHADQRDTLHGRALPLDYDLRCLRAAKNDVGGAEADVQRAGEGAPADQLDVAADAKAECGKPLAQAGVGVDGRDGGLVAGLEVEEWGHGA